MQANYRVTIADQDYHYTTYTAWVSASSKNQAIAKAAALAGAEKAIREYKRTGREPASRDAALTEPYIRLEHADLDEFWANQDTVSVTDDQGR